MSDPSILLAILLTESESDQLMSLLILGIGAAAGAATYALAKNRKKDTGTAAIAGSVAGVGTAGVAAVVASALAITWPLLLVGVPVAYWLHHSKKKPKALPPGRS